MNYELKYNNLISSRQLLNRSKKENIYYEKHHIIPKSCGGSNNKENLILLTFKEHYVAHLLLTKIYDGELKRKMLFALWQLTRGYKSKSHRILSASQYKICKEANVHASIGKKNSEETKIKIGKNNVGKHFKSDKEKEKMSKLRMGKKLSQDQKDNIKKTREKNGTNIITEETRKKMSIASFGRIVSEETKEKHRLINLGKKRSPETLIKIAETRLRNKLKNDTDPHQNVDLKLIALPK